MLHNVFSSSDAPMITLPSRLGAFLNSTFVFNVSVCANPTNYTIQFMKDGKELKPSDNLHIDKNVLTFKPISNSDNGNYTVKVTNIVGSTEEDFTLHVYGMSLLQTVCHLLL